MIEIAQKVLGGLLLLAPVLGFAYLMGGWSEVRKVAVILAVGSLAWVSCASGLYLVTR